MRAVLSHTAFQSRQPHQQEWGHKTPISFGFPRRALNAVLDWYVLHQEELMANWQAAIERKPLSKIEPLE